MRTSLNLAGSVFTVLLLALQPARCSEALDAARAAEDWSSVAEISRRELEKSPRDVSLWQARIGALLKMDGKERAASELHEWEKIAKPRPAAIDDLRGDLAMQNSDVEGAVKFWKASAKFDPKAVATLDKIAAKELFLNRWADAEKTLTQRLKVEPDASVYADRARVRLNLLRYKDAMADIREATRLDATNEKVKDLMPRLESFEKRQLPARIEQDKKVAAAPDDPFVLLDRALAASAADQDILALPDVKRAQELAPKSRRALLQLASVRERLSTSADLPRVMVKSLPVGAGLLREIGTLDTKLAAQPGDEATLTARATALNKARQWGLALDDAEAALKNNADDVAALVESGHALVHLEKYHDAARCLERATQLDPANPYAWLWRAELANERADHAAAADFASRSLSIRETPAGLRIRGEALRSLGRTAEADRDALKLSGTKK
jgi:tetratricopeptide (TPR) repeat protein